MSTVTGSRRLRHRIVAATMTALAIAAAVATPAQAEGVSGGSHYYDGKDPRTDGCNAVGSASQIATRPVRDRETGQQVATIQIFYSTKCATNWFRVTGNPYGGGANKFISSSLGGWNSEPDPGYEASFSMMVYAPGDTHIEGYVYLYEPGIEEYNWRAHGSFAL